ncbi:MAG TPA: BatA and WFA domain-containing protein [Dehalococcoidia bacterium]|nr:BatA and WFA domain-containing protein [Dehalococcoidia bacterium]
MIWLAPITAIVAASIAVPALLILYFLKLRRRDVEVSSTLLWKKAIQDLQANAPFQKLRRNILLLLQLLALSAMLLALGQPQITRQAVGGTRHVILIDRSASMKSLDEDDARGGMQSRLDAARKQALALVDSLREGGLMDRDGGDEAMVIAFAAQGEVLQPMTRDKAALRRAIEAITPTDAPTSIEEAMRLALAQRPRRVVENVGLDAGPPITFHIFSDGRIPDAEKAVPGPEDSVVFHRLGKPDASNVGIVGMRAERSFENPARLSVFVSLMNTSTTSRLVDVELLVDGAGAGIKTTTIPGAKAELLSAVESARAEAAEREMRETVGTSGSQQPAAPTRFLPGIGGVVFSLDHAPGATVQVRLRDPASGGPISLDVLPVDDSGWLVVPAARRLAVAVVSTKGNLFLSAALAGLPLAKLSEMSPDTFRKRVRDGTMGEYDVVILDGWLPDGAKAAPVADTAQPGPPPTEQLPPGRYLVLGSVPLRLGESPSGLKDLGERTGARIVDWRRDHPLLRAVNLDALEVSKGRALGVEGGAGAVVLAVGDDGPMIVEVSSADTRCIVVPFDIAESTWPFDVSFVVFLASATTYLSDDAGTGASGRMVQPGSVLSDRLPMPASGVDIRLPDGTSQKIEPGVDGRIVFGPLTTVGVHEVSWSGQPGANDLPDGSRAKRLYAANLFEPRESEVGSTDRVELASRVVERSGEQATQANRRLWPWLLAGALVVILLEWFVYNRKVQV